MSENKLSSVQDIKQHFRNSESAFYFISATNFNLMAVADWVNRWFNVNFIDCYDGRNDSVIMPDYSDVPVFKDIEAINQFLLGNKKIVEHIKSNRAAGHDCKAMFLFYDRELEKLVDSLDMDLIMPPNKLVRHIDNKITTTEIGNSVDVPSVPNALVKIPSYSRLREVIESNNLGDEVVIQTAYGDSGKTTFFIANEADYHAVADRIESEEQVKVMKRIQCLQVAMEACATRQGTYVGPILTEIIGHPKLTPYKGGWCGNDVNPDVFDKKTQQTMYRYTENLGHALYEKGYRGYFEVDYLIDVADRDDVQVYLGEINPRVTGISAITNMSAFCNQNIPLFLFHLLEFSDTAFDLPPETFNRSVQEFSHPEFGQLIFKYTEQTLKIITRVPETGVYSFYGKTLTFLRYADNPRQLADDEIFILRIMAADGYVYKGADILILFANKQLQDRNNVLTDVADALIDTVYSMLEYRELSKEEFLLTQRYGKHASLKSAADA